MISDILDELNSNDWGAMIVKPASSGDIALCQKDIAGLGLSAIPKDYLAFLKEANGIAWNGCEFYGTDQVSDQETGYTLGDLVSENEALQELPAPFMKDRLLLGRMDDDLFVYSAREEEFEILDASTGLQLEAFDTFDELFSAVLDPYLFTEDEEEDELSFEDDDEYGPGEEDDFEDDDDDEER